MKTIMTSEDGTFKVVVEMREDNTFWMNTYVLDKLISCKELDIETYQLLTGTSTPN